MTAKLQRNDGEMTAKRRRNDGDMTAKRRRNDGETTAKRRLNDGKTTAKRRSKTPNGGEARGKRLRKLRENSFETWVKRRRN